MPAGTRTIALLAASALIALAASSFAQFKNIGSPIHWRPMPVVTPAPAQTMAPVVADYLYRNGIIADLEADVQRHPEQLNTRMLAGQYLQRFREAPDVGDLLRAVANGQRSLHYQPRNNVAAESTLASAYAALHRFRLAKRYADDVMLMIPWSAGARATDASLDLELGEYEEAGKLLSRSSGAREDAGWETVAARYAELTGNISAARNLIARSLADMDSYAYTPAENRAWYHWRAGELAFEAGDLRTAEEDYKEALVIYPSYWHATNGLAKVYWARERWQQALAEATRSADIYPLPEALGYKYDAQRALNDNAGAQVTARLISAIEVIGNAKGINDRLIANFYSDHSIAPERAVAIARRDLALRDDIYAEDTLGWALAMDERWEEALPHANRAVVLGTQDARLQFHTAVIELHNGERDRALQRLGYALSLNPNFNPLYAAEARGILARGRL